MFLPTTTTIINSLLLLLTLIMSPTPLLVAGGNASSSSSSSTTTKVLATRQHGFADHHHPAAIGLAQLFQTPNNNKIISRKNKYENNNNNKIVSCQCGLYANREQQQLFFWQNGVASENVHFHSWSPLWLPSGSLVELRMDAERALGSGASSSTFHAEMVTRVEHGQELRQCVAIKISQIYGHEKKEYDKALEKDIKKEWEILEAFDTLPDQRARRHVINMLAYGQYDYFDDENIYNIYLFTILELANGDFMNHLKLKKRSWQTDDIEMNEQMLQQEILPVVMVARDIHQKIMHLDFKPANLMFVGQMLKAIDFGHSELIEQSAPGVHDEFRANKCKWFDYNGALTTPTYESLEHWQQCKTDAGKERRSMSFSTKSDIWAIGIICYEIAMSCSKNNEWEQANLNKHLILDQISKLYMLKRAVYFQNSTLVKNNKLVLEALKQMLRMELKFPRISRLLIAIFDQIPIMRPTAKGILRYLQGKCRLGNIALEHEIFSIKFLPGLSFLELKQILTQKRNVLRRLNFAQLSDIRIVKGVGTVLDKAKGPAVDASGTINFELKEIEKFLLMLDQVERSRLSSPVGIEFAGGTAHYDQYQYQSSSSSSSPLPMEFCDTETIDVPVEEISI